MKYFAAILLPSFPHFITSFSRQVHSVFQKKVEESSSRMTTIIIKTIPKKLFHSQ